jgi:Family of unknown function (DUF6286)
MRLINRVLAALLALALIVIGALIVIEVVTHWFSNTPAIVHWHKAYAWAARTPWKQGSVRVTCIILAVLGLILLIAELRPAKVSRLAADPAQAGADGIDAAYTRRGAAAAIHAAVSDVDGVRSASVTIKRRRVRVQATTSARDNATAQTLKDPITGAAQTRLTALQLRSQPPVSVHVSPRSR